MSDERDIYEVANQLQGYVDPGTPKPLAEFLWREGKAAERLADTIQSLRQTLEAEIEGSHQAYNLYLASQASLAKAIDRIAELEGKQ